MRWSCGVYLIEEIMATTSEDHVVVQEGAKQAARNGWREVTLGEAPIAIIDGDRGVNYPKQHEFLDRGHCLFLNAGNVTSDGFNFSSCAFVSSDIDQRLRKGKLNRHDVVLTTRGTVGNSAYFDATIPYEHVRINSGMVILRALQPALHPRYLYVLTQSQLVLSQIHALRTGSAQPQLPIRDIERITIPLPPLAEQRAIAHVLGTLDDKIELNRRMNETLEAMARALFKSWFVDFDPVRAKMDGRWQRGESLPGLPAERYDLFPERLVDSELGEIPEGWRVKALEQFVELNPYESMKKGTPASYLDMASLPTSGPNPDDAVMRDFKSGTRFRNGDTLLARITPCLENGKTAFIQSLQDGEIGWGSTEFIVMRAVPPVPPAYTYLLARDPVFRAHTIQSMTGTSGRQRASTEALRPFPLPYPPQDTWSAFRLLIERLFTRIETNRKESRSLAAQLDALLPRMVSGEIQSLGQNTTA